MPELQTVDVSSNDLYGVKGVKVLCTLLDVVPGLTHLHVGNNSLWEDTALLAPALRCLTCLRVLNMSIVRIGDKDMDALAPALAALPHLHTLDVSRNHPSWLLGRSRCCSWVRARSAEARAAVPWRFNLQC